MDNEEEIIETIKNIVDIQEQQINFDRKKVKEILKQAQREFPIESATYEISGSDNRGIFPIEVIDSNIQYNKLPYYKSLYLKKLKDKINNEKKYNEIIKNII